MTTTDNKAIEPQDMSRLDRWERWIGYIILATTVLIISPTTVDSYIMPKFVWLACWSALWLAVIAQRVPLRSLLGSALDKPIALLLGLAVLSILFDYRSGLQIRAILHLFPFVILYYAYRRYWAIGGCPYMTTALLMLTSTLLAVYGLMQDYGIDFYVTSGGVNDWRAKVVGTVGNPNFLAEYLAICLPAALAYGLRQGASVLAVAVTALVLTILIACHTVTFCVGATMAYAVTLVISAIAAAGLRVRPKFSYVKLVLFLLCMASAAGWYLLDNPYNSHGGSLYQEAWKSPQWFTGAGSRVFNWRTSRYMIQDEPLFGIGYGNYLTKSIHYQGINYERQGRPHDRNYVIPVDQPHFQWLETAAEMGPLGALALAWLVTAWVKASLPRLRNDKHRWFAWGCWGGVWIAIVHSFANFPFHIPGSSLVVVVLASYLTSGTGAGSAIVPPAAWKRAAVLILAGIFALANYTEYLGSQYLRRGMESEGFNSIYNLETAKRYDPFSYKTHYMLGVRSLEMKWHGRAEESLRRALVYQEDLNVHKMLVQMYLQQNNLAGAIAEQRRVLELNPAFPGHYHELAEMMRRAGEPDEADRIEARGEELRKQL